MFFFEMIGLTRKREKGTFLKCQQCGKEFYVFPCWIKRGRKFCSRECKDESLKGKSPSEETKLKMSLSQIGKHLSIKITHYCLFCRKEFQTIPSAKGKFCSKYCKNKSQIGKSASEGTKKNMSESQIKRKREDKKVALQCENCGKEFFALFSRLKQNKKFCSFKCKCEASENKVKYICNFCGIEFFRAPSMARKITYCSWDCSVKGRVGKTPSGDKIENNCKCLMCGKEFHKALSVREDERGKYCSKKCKDIFQQGENSPMWRGGMSFGKYCKLFNNRFKESIRSKFGRKCFVCGKDEKQNKQRLSIHHIDYFKASICHGQDWAFVPLCLSCHAKTNSNRYFWFNYLINFWAFDPEVNFNLFNSYF
jgi:hypothetical protein